jgi:short-subunit dehydrogenase
MSASILITGASSGIGKALAFELAGRGYRLALTARRQNELERIGAEIAARHAGAVVHTRRLDVTDLDLVPQTVPQLAETLGGLDIVLANAGISLAEHIGRRDFDSVRRMVEVNLVGAMATVDSAVAHFLQRGRGHVVGISSVIAYRGLARNAAYCASKAGLAVYLEALRLEVLSKNIDVTVLYPGYIDTPLNQRLPQRPFLISAEKGAAIMADRIERRARSAFVPPFPWSLIARMLRVLPAAVVARF